MQCRGWRMRCGFWGGAPPSVAPNAALPGSLNEPPTATTYLSITHHDICCTPARLREAKLKDTERQEKAIVQ